MQITQQHPDLFLRMMEAGKVEIQCNIDDVLNATATTNDEQRDMDRTLERLEQELQIAKDWTDEIEAITNEAWEETSPTQSFPS